MMADKPRIPPSVLALLQPYYVDQKKVGMPDERRRKLESTLEGRIEVLRSNYQNSGNPVHLWRAYAALRELGRTELPDWIVEYLDAAALNLMEISAEALDGSLDNPAASISEAMGFKRPGKSGRKNAFTDANEVSWAFLGHEVMRYMDDYGYESYAIEEVAKKHGLSIATVRRAYKKYLVIVKQE